MIHLYLVRHAHNDFTGKSLVGRRKGVHLNDEGRQQAQDLARALKNIHLDAIFSSPSERTLETAEPMSKTHRLEIKPCIDLQEIDFGDWQGLSLRYLRHQQKWKELIEHGDSFTFPGGESVEGAQKRVVTALKDILSEAKDGSSLMAVTHGDCIRLAVTHFLGLPVGGFHHFHVDTASVTTLVFEGKDVWMERFNWRIDLGNDHQGNKLIKQHKQ